MLTRSTLLSSGLLSLLLLLLGFSRLPLCFLPRWHAYLTTAAMLTFLAVGNHHHRFDVSISNQIFWLLASGDLRPLEVSATLMKCIIYK
jgi:hypothetical protein